MHQERAVGDLQHFDTVNVFYRTDNLVLMFTGDRVDRNIANNVVAGHTDNVDRTDVAAGFANRGSHFAESAGASGKFDAQGQAITVAG